MTSTVRPDVAAGRSDGTVNIELGSRVALRLLRSPIAKYGCAFGLLAGALFYLPGRGSIPPLIESDYAYLLTAADRFVAGNGLTTTPPVAPHQAWEWQTDWAFLTRWPCGYPLMIAAVRILSGVSTIEACRIISVLVCAAALTGWFALAMRCVPRSINGVLLALVASSCAVSTAALVNPSTDAIVVALIPIVLLLTLRGIAPGRSNPIVWDPEPRASARADAGPRSLAATEPTHDESIQGSTGEAFVSNDASFGWLATAGLLAGSLFWIRYASIFVPAGIGVFLLIRGLRGGSPGLKGCVTFAVAAAMPITALLVLNRAMGAGASASEQLNLGHRVGFDFSPALLSTAWWKLTEFGFYAHRWMSHWAFAIWPMVLLIAVALNRTVRASLSRFAARPAVGLCVSTLATLVVMLILATTLFGAKFDYVSLDRYYLAAKPIYFLLFVAPLLALRWRVPRAAIGLALVVLMSWQVRQEWPRPYQRWVRAEREASAYGQWANCFSPGAAAVYQEITNRADDNTIVISNFHEWIALETNIPALPIPKDTATLDRWISVVCQERGIQTPRVLFVLDRNNRWRDYWIEPVAKIVHKFGLTPLAGSATLTSTDLLTYRRQPAECL
ncbi:MAG: hypothetical protein ACE5E5_10365 [Phycisphaerae bacterium]